MSASRIPSPPALSRLDTLPDGVAEVLGKARPAVGDVVGERYRVLSFLGEGAMGQVFAAENLAIGARVALKVLRAELLASPEFRERFQQEAEAVAAIGHPNVVRFLDLVVGSPTFLVMEYVAGPTLAQVLREAGRLEIERAVRLARRLLGGLDAAHAVGVVHRDLKPANILCATDRIYGEVPKLIDFGLAKLALRSSSLEPLTRKGQVVGTPHYMAPEQITGGKVDARTDLYALGSLLYHMIAGQPPFGDSSDDFALMYRVVHEAPPSLRSLVPEVSPVLNAVVERALAKDPEGRFGSAEEMLTALGGAIISQNLERQRQEADAPQNLELAPPAPPRASRPPAFVWGLAGLALVTAGLAAVSHLRGRAAPLRPALLLVSQPSGASVELDGRLLAGTTPLALPRASIGPHRVRLSKGGYGAVERHCEVGPREPTLVEAVLPPLTHRVTVRSVPEGASVYFDGALQNGTTPLTVEAVSGEFHALRLERGGFEVALARVTPEDTEKIIVLVPERGARGAIMVHDDSGAEIWIDGGPTGFRTPAPPLSVAAGRHEVSLRVDQGPARSASVTVKEGEAAHLTFSPSR